MTVVPFQPKREDGRSEWQLIYELIVEFQVGDVLRYEALDELLDRNFREQGSGRSPLPRAMVELERTHQRTLRNIPRVGYEVVEGGAQVVLAQNQVHRGHRRIRRAAILGSTTKRDALTHEQSKRLDSLQLHVERLDSDLRHYRAKAERQEQLLDQIRNKKVNGS